MNWLNVDPKYSRIITYLLYLWNLYFLVLGIFVIAAGNSIQNEYADYEQFIEQQFFSIPILLSRLGIVLIIINLIGIYGVKKKNHSITLTFVAFMVLMLIFGVFACKKGFAIRSSTSDLVKKKMMASMKGYNNPNRTDIISRWDKIQRQLQCCGTNDPTDWQNTWDATNEEWKIKKYLPYSCCKIKDGLVGDYPCKLEEVKENRHYYEHGCEIDFSVFLESHAVKLIYYGLSVALGQPLGIWFALLLAKLSKESVSSYVSFEI